MNRFQNVILIGVVGLMSLWVSQALGFTTEACVQPTQFQSALCDTVSSDPPAVSAVSDSNANATTSATAAPFQLTATASSTGAGSTLARASARFTDATIVFEDARALAALLPPQTSTLKLRLNLALSVVLDTTDNPGSLTQAVATVNASVTTATVGFLRLNEGHATILNSPFDHVVTTNGFFTELSEPGGSLLISLPVVLQPLEADGLTVSIKASVDVSSMALVEGFADAAVELSLPQDSAMFMLVDGTPLADVGVVFTLHPPLVRIQTELRGGESSAETTRSATSCVTGTLQSCQSNCFDIHQWCRAVDRRFWGKIKTQLEWDERCYRDHNNCINRCSDCYAAP